MELTISRTAALTGKIAAAIRTVFKRARLLGRYRRRAAVVVISEGRPSRCHDERDRKFADSPLEEDGFEPSVPPRREWLWGTTPGKHRRLEPVSGSALRVTVSDWQRPEEPFAGAGPKDAMGRAAEEMATSSLHFIDGVPRCPSRTT